MVVLGLLPGKDQLLLILGVTLLVLDLDVHIVNGIGSLHLQSDGFPGQGFRKDLYANAETQHQVESELILDVVFR